MEVSNADGTRKYKIKESYSLVSHTITVLKDDKYIDFHVKETTFLEELQNKNIIVKSPIDYKGIEQFRVVDLLTHYKVDNAVRCMYHEFCIWVINNEEQFLKLIKTMDYEYKD
jgi:hypothetical protein